MLRRRGGLPDDLIRTFGSVFGMLVIGGSFAAAVLIDEDRVAAVSVVLGVAAVVAGFVFEGGEETNANVSASFIVIALAAALGGPVSAGLAAAITELCAAIRFRNGLIPVTAVNLPACVLPAVGEGVLIHALVWPPSERVTFYVVVGLAALAGYVANFLMVIVLSRLSGFKIGSWRGALVDSLPSTALSLALALAGVGIELQIGIAGIAFALVAVLAFSYMIHLVRESRHRASQQAALSWGVLAGLMRSLDIRDERTARHSAAVARFARDIAAQVGMDDTQQELAHTAGLLHDIGRFALSDRVFDRGRTLTEEDWVAIQRHPELGADMLRDLGAYGPVAEIVLAHHERIDGRGYPHNLDGEAIPEIAKIIAVAEVYDTLTASDTYRTQMSSFEALTELRRVSGSQLDGGYVEVLAGLLTGEGVEYRHADTADFDTELNIERRISQAATGR